MKKTFLKIVILLSILVNTVILFDISYVSYTFNGNRWINGEKVVNSRTVSGDSFNSNNLPGARSTNFIIQINFDIVLLFGGEECIGEPSCSTNMVNDLWEYNISKNMFRRIRGNDSINPTPVYNNSCDPYNSLFDPGGRTSIPIRYDDEIFIFGGKVAVQANANDVWSMNLSTYEWRYYKGNFTVPNWCRDTGKYYDLFEFSSNSWPGCRRGEAVVKYDEKTFIIFFGQGSDSVSEKRLNDVWWFDLILIETAWMHGPTIGNGFCAGGFDYYSPSNFVSARAGPMVSKIHGEDTFVVYGGNHASNEWHGCSDMWFYNGTLNQYKYVGGVMCDPTGVPKSANFNSNNFDEFNFPGGRNTGLFIQVSEDEFFLFGGKGFDINDNVGYLSDHWMYSISLKQWKYLSGPKLIDQRSVYDVNNTTIGGTVGTKGILLETVKNNENAIIWLFGGNSVDKNGTKGKMNHVWETRLKKFCQEPDHYDASVNCSVTKCFGIFSNESGVCLSHGKCIEFNCTCDDHYFLDENSNCNISECFGIRSDNPEVCNNNGYCFNTECFCSNNNPFAHYNADCTCENEYFGNYCNISQCFGEFSNQSNVCNERGVCLDQECLCDAQINNINFSDCSCLEGHYGYFCNITYCFEIPSTNPQVCSNHGECVDSICECEYNYENFKPDCSCEDEYHGWFCNITNCYGIYSNNSEICSGHGECILDSNELFYCNCSQNYEGIICDFLNSSGDDFSWWWIFVIIGCVFLCIVCISMFIFVFCCYYYYRVKKFEDLEDCVDIILEEQSMTTTKPEIEINSDLFKVFSLKFLIFSR